MNAPTICVFLNEKPVHVAPTATLRDAVAAHQPELLPLLDAGRAILTDGTGCAVTAHHRAVAGQVFRVIRSAKRE